jgi:glycosyltransferase involved in cell wall biosynthesis
MSIKLSTALVLKNESEGIYRCLDSVKHVTDQFVIGIDSKTSDGTEKEVERFFQDNPTLEKDVYSFEWKDSFSAARNEGLDKCTGDYILVMDGHEYIPDSWYNITMKEHMNSQLALKGLKEKLAKGQADQVFFQLYQQPFQGMVPSSFFDQPRIYRNGESTLEEHKGKKLRFNRAAHNTIMYTDRKKDFYWPEVLIIHEASQENRKERSKQRIEMNTKQLLEDLKKNERDTRALFYLGNTYLEAKDWDKSIEAFTKYIDVMEGEHSELYQVYVHCAMAYRAKEDYKKCREFLHHAVAIEPERRDALCALGDLSLEKEQWRKAVFYYNTSLAVPSHQSRMFQNGAINTYQPHSNIAHAYMKMGENKKAIAHLRAALQYVNNGTWIDKIKDLSGDKKKVLIVDAIGSFTNDYEKHLKDKGYEVIKSKTATSELIMWADYIWQEWADKNAQHTMPTGKTTVRVHGYEAYLNGGVIQQALAEPRCKIVYVADHIRRMVGDQGKGVVIQNGVDTESFYIKSYDRDPKSIGYAGFLNGKKNPMRLARIIKANPGHNFHLRIDWQDPFLEHSFKYETADCKNIVYHGRYDDLNDFWNQMNGVISTSDIESFSFNVAEAMACGCRPYVYNWRGAKEIWSENHIFEDMPKFMDDVSNMNRDAFRDYILENYSLQRANEAMEAEMVRDQ